MLLAAVGNDNVARKTMDIYTYRWQILQQTERLTTLQISQTAKFHLLQTKRTSCQISPPQTSKMSN